MLLLKIASLLDVEPHELTDWFWEIAEEVRIHDEETRHGLRNEIWTVRLKDGATRRLDPGDLWQANSDEIARLVNAGGVRLTCERQ